MIAFLCALWPYLFGGLMGWVICGLMARELRFAPVTEPKVPMPVVKPELEKLKESGEKTEQLGFLEKGSVSPPESKSNEAKIVERIVEVEKKVEVDNPKLIKRIAELEKQLRMASSVSGLGEAPDDKSIVAAAKAAGFKMKEPNDFTVVEGIGPKINKLLHEAGINTYEALAATDVEKIQQILKEAGSRFSLAVPKTWPKQAEYAARNEWQALKEWQDQLDGGK